MFPSQWAENSDNYKKPDVESFLAMMCLHNLCASNVYFKSKKNKSVATYIDPSVSSATDPTFCQFTGRSVSCKYKGSWIPERILGFTPAKATDTVISLLSCGSETWDLNPRACKMLRGANSRMLTWFTGNSIPDEA